MATTKGNLTAAVIYDVDTGAASGVPCMFNPTDYAVTKSNTYEPKSKNGSGTPFMEFKKSGSQTLSLKLVFDTYEEGTDVSAITNKLWTFMEPKPRSGSEEKEAPPVVAFQWGVFTFEAVVTKITQSFTLFLKDGTPVRAKVDVDFTQHKDPNAHPRQNPTSGGGPIQRVHSVKRGDRLDLIAAEAYGDATKWRQIAAYNGLNNPLDLRPGQKLAIPEEV